MQENILLKTIPENKMSQFTKEELIILYQGEQKIRQHFEKELNKIKSEQTELKQRSLFVEEQLITLKSKYFGKSSEKSPKIKNSDKRDTTARKKQVKLPSLRYPNAPLIEKDITLDVMPTCSCCNEQMKDSGMTEDSEYLTAIPRQFFVVRQKRHKYRCGKCHGDLITTPVLPRIKQGSSYSDEMIVDIALSKYCDLIPIERYKMMASRSGIKGLPANSLIQLTHNLSDFLIEAYNDLKEEVKSSKVLHADETPHKMLEGDKKSNWYLWGFSNDKSAYFELQDTRSGDIASSFLKGAACEYLVTDIFSGYSKAVRDANVLREEINKNLIKNIYCNAHARRKFKESAVKFEIEGNYFIKCYQKIYKLEQYLKKHKSPLSFKQIRHWQKIYFDLMNRMAIALHNSYSTKSSIGKAIRYFIRNFDELTLFLKFDDIPIDNNAQERLMRNPVIGRKTWYGTHSKRGAQTNAILFSLVESCKINNINPREYFRDLVEAIHLGKPAFTPAKYENIAE